MPLKQKVISIKDQLKPWITPIINSDIKRNRYCVSLCKRNKMSRHEYKFSRNLVNNETVSVKKDYYRKLFLKIGNDVYQTWTAINKVLNSRNNKIFRFKLIIVQKQNIYRWFWNISSTYWSFCHNWKKNSWVNACFKSSCRAHPLRGIFLDSVFLFLIPGYFYGDWEGDYFNQKQTKNFSLSLIGSVLKSNKNLDFAYVQLTNQKFFYSY